MCDAARKVIVNGVQLIIVINLMCKMYNYIFHKGNESPLLFIYSNSCETHLKQNQSLQSRTSDSGHCYFIKEIFVIQSVPLTDWMTFDLIQ